MNAFRNRDTGKIDRQYLRTCACYKLLKLGKINQEQAVRLMEQSGVKGSKSTVELWSMK